MRAWILILPLILVALIPAVSVEASSSRSPPNTRRRVGVSWADETVFSIDGVELSRFRIYVNDQGNDNYRLSSRNETHVVFQSSRGRGRIVFEKLSDGKWKFNAYINASTNNAVLTIEIGFNGHVRQRNRTLVVDNYLVHAGVRYDFADAPNTTITQQGNRYLIQIPLRQGYNVIDPVIETFTYLRLTPPAPVQPGDVLAPHLYDWYFDGLDDYIRVNRSFAELMTFTVAGIVNPVPTNPTSTELYWDHVLVRFSFRTLNVPHYARHYFIEARCTDNVWRSVVGPIYNIYDGQFHTVTFSIFNSSSIRFYWDGTLRHTATFPCVMNPNPAEVLTIGGVRNNRYYRGYISTLILYSEFFESDILYGNRVINASNLHLFLDPTFWNGTHYIDLSGRGNHGVPFNGVRRVPADITWLWVIRGNYSDNLVRLRFFPNNTIIRFANGDTLDLSSYTANSAGLVEYVEITRTDIQDILVPDVMMTLYTGYPENPEVVYANIDTVFGVLVSHSANVSRVNTVKMKIGDAVFMWNRESGFYEESDPRSVARLSTADSYVLYYNMTHMAVYFRFKLDWSFDTEPGHKWHSVVFEAYSDDNRYALMPVQDAFMFIDTATPVNITLPTRVYVNSYIEILGNLVYTGTNIPITDYYGVKICVENSNKTACYDPLILDPATGEFKLRHYVDTPGNHTIRVYAVVADGEAGFNNNADFTAELAAEPVAEEKPKTPAPPVYAVPAAIILLLLLFAAMRTPGSARRVSRFSYIIWG